MNVDRKKLVDLCIGGTLIGLIRAPVYLLGLLLRRDHSLTVRGDILFIKMQGGGSLVIAYPALLGIRRRYPHARLLLLTTPTVRPFAESLAIFDGIVSVDDRNLWTMAASTLRALRQTLRVDTVVDLEVYSRLTTVFSVLTAARNRMGFYLESTYWRRYLHTHLVFFNRFSGSYHFYEEIARKFGASIPGRSECEATFRASLPGGNGHRGGRRVALGHGCSEMGTERMLSPEQWRTLVECRAAEEATFVFLGSEADRAAADRIIDALEGSGKTGPFVNECGELSLLESIHQLDTADEFWGIDSALLHYARLLGKPNVSVWGPTNPRTRLRYDPDLPSAVYYKKVPCSPCIHVAERPPCNGKNVCMDALFSGHEVEAGEDLPVLSRLDRVGRGV
jgi:ADP-heptose:LPS heptosyltransferase